MLSPLLRELLSARRDVFLLLLGERILCSCGDDLESIEAAENHLVARHERKNTPQIQPNMIQSEFQCFLQRLKDSSQSLKAPESFPLPPKSPFSICPNEELFPTSLNDLQCPQCPQASIQNFTALRKHFISVHGKWLPSEGHRFSTSPSTGKRLPPGSQYFCPLPSCKSHLFQAEPRHFSTWKLLKQHYRKVHALRNIVCGVCGESYPTELDLRTHTRYNCGKEYRCSDCGVTYSRYENLQTHCRRKGHSLGSKAPLGHLDAAIALSQLSCPMESILSREIKKDAPKADIAVQTGSKRRSVHKDLPRKIRAKIARMSSPPMPDILIHTASSSTSCANTQTPLDDADLLLQEVFSSSETQTCWDKDVLLSSTSRTPRLGEISQFSTETQTDLNEKWRHSETQFSLLDTLFDGEDLLRSIETQTSDQRAFSSSETQT
eukprot:TRINITY_DN4250_c0_g1_i1.p1 TRINITY_DN4250_c0_g1~~TRINITY_DN4250_c0_g1_i1.p1  ORF type:complete len:435 (+),score=90.19 TRINITY_DN4250_c0_g1_i1:437-1741(+)